MPNLDIDIIGIEIELHGLSLLRVELEAAVYHISSYVFM